MPVLLQNSIVTTTTTVNAGTPISISNTFSHTTAGNSLLVLVGYTADNISYAHPTSLTDTQGNTYTQAFQYDHATNSGPGLAAYFAPNIVGGANTFTLNAATSWLGFGTYNTSFYLWLLVAEYSAPHDALIFSSSVQQLYAATTCTLTVNTTAGTPVNCNVTCNNGNVDSWALIDLSGGGIDRIIACGLANGGQNTINPSSDVLTVSPGAGTLVLTQSSINTDAGHYFAFYDSIAYVNQRGNIDIDQIGADVRQGAVYGTKVQCADGNFTSGNIPKFLNDGTISDSGTSATALRPVTLQTNGTNNANQSKLNLIAGANVTLNADGSGGVTIIGTSFTAGGDLSGTSTSQNVIGIQGKPVISTAPTDGQVLTYVGADGKWEPKAPTGGSGFTAGSDLSGTSTAQTVVGIQGKPVISTAPTDGQVLTYVGADSKWEPKTPASGIALQTNGTANTVQNKLNLIAGTNVSLTSDSSGDVTITATTATGGNFADAETPAGTINGTNSSFTLAHTPNPTTSLRLYKNGVLQRPSVDYATNGSTIYYSVAPRSTYWHIAFYRY